MKLNNKGMTLVEIIIGFVLLAIILSVMGGVYLSSMQYFTHFSEKRDSKILADSLVNFLQKNVGDATDIYLSGSADVPDGWVDSEENWLCYAARTVLSSFSWTKCFLHIRNSTVAAYDFNSR